MANRQFWVSAIQIINIIRALATDERIQTAKEFNGFIRQNGDVGLRMGNRNIYGKTLKYELRHRNI